MKKYMILFTVGSDRPGIVDDVTTILYAHSANIEDSRMAAMGGCFSIMTLFSCPEEVLDAVSSDLKKLKHLLSEYVELYT